MTDRSRLLDPSSQPSAYASRAAGIPDAGDRDRRQTIAERYDDRPDVATSARPLAEPYVAGHVIHRGPPPILTMGTGAGTGPTSVGTAGTDACFRIIFVTGTAPAAIGSTIATVTFAAPWQDSDYEVWIQEADSDSATIAWYWEQLGHTEESFEIRARTVLAASTSYRLSVRVDGHPY